MEYFDNLKEIKEQLFDASTEVKQAFNQVVEYFAGKSVIHRDSDNNKMIWVNYKTKSGKSEIKQFKSSDWEDFKEFMKSKGDPIMSAYTSDKKKDVE